MNWSSGACSREHGLARACLRVGEAEMKMTGCRMLLRKERAKVWSSSLVDSGVVTEAMVKTTE